jgi:hypothetical protein
MSAHNSSQAYVEQAMPAMLTSWDPNELIDRASPELLADTPPEEMRVAFRHYADHLGRLQRYEGATIMNTQVNSGAPDYAELQARASFERGDATIDMLLVRHTDQWQIAGFNLKSPALYR